MFIYIHSVSKLQLLTLHCWLAMVRKIKNIDIIFIIRKVWRYQRRNNNHLLVNAKRNLFDSIILVELHHVLLKWLYQARKASAHVYISMGYWCFLPFGRILGIFNQNKKTWRQYYIFEENTEEKENTICNH